ncbi:uracil phosphoribosyltransferase [bacterium]|nr:uracil phosphoribosyltransferase [bacterium]
MERDMQGNHFAVQRFLTFLRDKKTDAQTFRWASDNLSRLLCGEALSKLPHEQVEIVTPVGAAEGQRLLTEIMVVPIYRAGQSLVHAFLEVVPDAAVGSLLIQRDERTAQPELFYKKLVYPLPACAIILDPMLATAGSAVMAVRVLREEGYRPQSIYFVGVVAAEEGFNRLAEHIPEANITVAAVDPLLNDKKYIVPGLGDYGDRYFGT